MKRSLLAIMVVVVAFGFDVPGVMAEDVLFARVNANYAPFEMVVDGKLTGLHIELVYATASRLGVNVEFQSLPWKRAIHMVEIGTADAITYV
ncbi:MAG: amino acid ABC transporter substrate-binding protein, partial [Proteobacteria bacterium]|nr:amino acid ABC transporter substrate-binding protein [Pseudomonadota bacterium]